MCENFEIAVSHSTYGLSVSIPTNGHVITNFMCENCQLKIEGRSIIVDLIFLPLEDINIILGMDLHNANMVRLDF